MCIEKTASYIKVCNWSAPQFNMLPFTQDVFCGKVRTLIVNSSIRITNGNQCFYPNDNIPTIAAIFDYNDVFDVVG